MISGHKLSKPKFLCHFIALCILYIFLIVQWAYQIKYFNLMSPYYGKGGLFSMLSYYLTLLIWVLNLVAVVCITSSIVLYFVAEYWLGPKGKDLSKMYRTQHILAKCGYNFMTASTVIGFITAGIGIWPELGLYDESDDANARILDQKDTYKNKYISMFLPTSSHLEICALGAFGVAERYGKKYRDGKIDTKEFIALHAFFLKLTGVTLAGTTNFSPLCFGALIPMAALSFIMMFFIGIVSCLYHKYMKDHETCDAPSSSSSSSSHHHHHHHKKSNKKSKSSKHSDSSIHEDASL